MITLFQKSFYQSSAFLIKNSTNRFGSLANVFCTVSTIFCIHYHKLNKHIDAVYQKRSKYVKVIRVEYTNVIHNRGTFSQRMYKGIEDIK